MDALEDELDLTKQHLAKAHEALERQRAKAREEAIQAAEKALLQEQKVQESKRESYEYHQALRDARDKHGEATEQIERQLAETQEAVVQHQTFLDKKAKIEADMRLALTGDVFDAFELGEADLRTLMRQLAGDSSPAARRLLAALDRHEGEAQMTRAAFVRCAMAEAPSDIGGFAELMIEWQRYARQARRDELNRLKAENDRLKAQLAKQANQISAPQPKTTNQISAPQPKTTSANQISAPQPKKASAPEPKEETAPAPPPAQEDTEGKRRIAKLLEVFKAFDLDSSGTIEPVELFELGKARRTLGQKQGEWTEDLNLRAVRKMDTNKDGKIGAGEFAKFFDDTLPKNPASFDHAISDFMAVAKRCREKNEEDSWRVREEQAKLKAAAAATPVLVPSLEQEAAEKKRRIAKLLEVFKAFDLDGSGTIEASELFELGKARRKLGQKQGEWTREMNRRMMKQMDTNKDGVIGAGEFAQFFERTLPNDPTSFDRTVADFMAVAKRCREEKVEAKKRGGSSGRNKDIPMVKTQRKNDDLRAEISRLGTLCSSDQGDKKTAEQTLQAPESSAAAQEDKEKKVRIAMLLKVFKAFDLDDSGTIEASELFELGTARRKLGQKQGEWTEEMNRRAVRKMDTNKDGKIGAGEFAKFFDEALPKDPTSFDGVIADFMAVAKHSRDKKKEVGDKPSETSPKPQDDTSWRERQEKAKQKIAASSPPTLSDSSRDQLQSSRDFFRMEKKRRTAKLLEVFKAFDLDRSGTIEPVELFELGKARRTLGQKQGEWTEEMNRRAVRKMDTNKDGKIGAGEFAKFFDEALPKDPTSFDRIMIDFMAVAKHSREPKDTGSPGTPRTKAARMQMERQLLLQMHPDQQRIRIDQLISVFQAFDLDGSGAVEPGELLKLGQARRHLGQKQGEWTNEQNARLVSKMDTNADGKVDKMEFAHYFEQALPRDPQTFESTIADFRDVAIAASTLSKV